MHINIWENPKSTRFTEITVRLNFEKELKSTVCGREFQHFITRSLKKLACTQFMVWGLKSFNLCLAGAKIDRSSRLL